MNHRHPLLFWLSWGLAYWIHFQRYRLPHHLVGCWFQQCCFHSQQLSCGMYSWRESCIGKGTKVPSNKSFGWLAGLGAMAASLVSGKPSCVLGFSTTAVWESWDDKRCNFGGRRCSCVETFAVFQLPSVTTVFTTPINSWNSGDVSSLYLWLH